MSDPARFKRLYGHDQPTPDTPAAARRDASWFRNPSTSGSAAKLHVTTDGHTAKCNASMPVISEELRSLDSVDSELRCQRRGCKELWPESRP